MVLEIVDANERRFSVTNFMEKSPFERLIVTQLVKNFPAFLWNRKVRYRPPLVPVLSQMNPAHILRHYFRTIHSNIILTSVSTSSKHSLPFTCHMQTYLHIHCGCRFEYKPDLMFLISFAT